MRLAKSIPASRSQWVCFQEPGQQGSPLALTSQSHPLWASLSDHNGARVLRRTRDRVTGAPRMAFQPTQMSKAYTREAWGEREDQLLSLGGVFKRWETQKSAWLHRKVPIASTMGLLIRSYALLSATLRQSVLLVCLPVFQAGKLKWLM